MEKFFPKLKMPINFKKKNEICLLAAINSFICNTAALLVAGKQLDYNSTKGPGHASLVLLGWQEWAGMTARAVGTALAVAPTRQSERPIASN